MHSSDGWAKFLLPHPSVRVCMIVLVQRLAISQKQNQKRITSFKQSHPEILLCSFRAGKSLDSHRAFSGRVIKQISLSQGAPRGPFSHAGDPTPVCVN